MRILPVLLIVPVLAGCAGSLAGRLTLPDRNELVRDQLVIRGDFPLAMHHRLFEELTSQRADLCRRLALPASDEPIYVYLFESEKRFQGFMRLHYPKFPDRRAFFVETDSELTVYAQWGERMGEDLRHEVTHAYLHAVVPNVPLWLDEGVAEFYEAPRHQQGLNRSHLDRLAARINEERWLPDLWRLEQLPNPQAMTQDHYAEAWAWVHFLTHSRPELLGTLQGYLADLRRDGAARPISVRLKAIMRQPEVALVEHLRQLQQETGAR